MPGVSRPLAAVSLAVIAAGCGPWSLAAEKTGKGAIVEAVAAASPGERARLRPGDVILRWSRAGAGGEIESPLHLFVVEAEQAPLGTVTLEGRRGAEGRTWRIDGTEPWRISARPDLPPPLLGVHREAEALARGGDPLAAAARLRKAARRAQGGPGWLAPWLLSRVAATLAAGKQFAQSDATYAEAIDRAAAAPAVAASLVDQWYATFEGRTDRPARARYCERARALVERLGPESLTSAQLLTSAGYITSMRGDGDHDQAEKYYHRGLAIREKRAPGSVAVALSLRWLGILWEDRHPQTSERFHRRAIGILEKVAPGSAPLAAEHNALAVTLRNAGELVQAKESCKKALAISETLPPDRLRANILHNLALIAIDGLDYLTAEKYVHASMKIRERIAPGSLSMAESLHQLGQIAWARNDLDLAERYFHQALALREKLAPDGMTISFTLNNLGLMAAKRGDLARADELLDRSLRIKKLRVPGSAYVATALIANGEVAEERRDWARAAALHREALAMAQKVMPRSPITGRLLSRLGGVFRKRGDLDAAETYYRQSLALLSEVVPGTANQADALAGLAAVLVAKGQPEPAAQLYDRALAALEEQITHLGGASAVRASFRAERAGYYAQYVDLLQAQKQPERAFHVWERSRARSLLEMLAEGEIDVRAGVEPQLLERELSLKVQVAAKTGLRVDLLGEAGQQPDRLAAVEREIEALLGEYRQVQDQVRATSPRYAGLTQPQPLGVREVQARLLDPDTLLLEYALGEARSHLWVVGARSIASHQLPRREEIDAAARRVYELITAPNARVPGESAERRRARLADAAQAYPAAAAALSRMVLGPLTGTLGTKRLLVVSDGALQYIPFALLPAPAGPPVPLVVEHEIIHLPSASVLALMRDRSARKRAPQAVAVLADPVFDRADERLAIARGQTGAGGGAPPGSLAGAWSDRRLTRSAADVGLARAGGPLPRLRFTRFEADAIEAASPRGQVMKALDFAASRRAAISPELGKYRVVHFATHGLLDSVHPELSGLVLSLVDENGAPQNGYLGLDAVYNLDLAAELVVLSGCETGLGKEINGEGLIGLTRGFMYAGAARVMASLWKVDDLATSQLMARFYRAMHGQNLRPAAALRQAQIEMWRGKDTSSPYQWGAFQIQGDWR